MFVKICGITNREDALAAVDAGARALGFIFHPASPRHVTAEQLEPWINEIPAEIWKVGVFVDEAPELIERISAQLGLDIAQLHGSETPDRHPGLMVGRTPRSAADALVASPGLDEAEAVNDRRVQGNPRGPGGPPHETGLRVWKAFRVKDAETAVPDYPAAEAILIDGEAYDWSQTSHFTRPLILAGGLDENNVRERIHRAKRSGQPWGVDVASGIESSPGRKDHARMKKFIEAALSS